MKFVLSFLLVFLCVFATAQVPPMVIGGPQGIDVTRILARNWMSIPIYVDTPVAPLTGSGWPGKGYIIQVAKAGDTSVWQYTGQRWAKIAGASQETYTKLVTGGDVNQLGLSRQYTVSPSTYFINGVYYNLTTQQTVTSPVKTANANARIDVIALTTTGATVVQGTERPVPLKPSVGPNRLELAAIYYPAFDTVSREISEGGLTSVFRILGRDSIYFTSGDSVISVKDSIGISKNDTAAMLNPYKFTAANGLTKDSTVFRLGGSLNQNTDINLNTRRLTIIGGSDTTRFFSNGSLSLGATPSDSTYRFNVNGGTKTDSLVVDSLYAKFGTTLASGVPVAPIEFRIASSKTRIDLRPAGFGGWNNNWYGAITHTSSETDVLSSPYGSLYLGTTNYFGSGGIYLGNTRNNPSMHIRNNNNVLIGDTANTGFRFDVNGTSRFRSSSYFSDGRIFYGPSSSDTALVMKNTQSNTASPGISIGNNSTPVFARSAIFGDMNIITGQVPYTGGYLNNIVGNNNTVDSSGNIIVIGNDNSVPNPTSHQIVLGYNNVSNSSTNSQNASIVIGLGNNTNSFRGGGLIGSGLKYYANSQLAFGGNSNNVDFSIKNVYFGNGVKNEHNNLNANFGNGPDVTINPSWANDVDSINRNGGSLTLAGGRGTGTGTPGAVIFSTWNTTTSGSTLHPTLTERARISERGNLLVGTSTDDTSSLVNIVSTAKGFLQPRMTNTQRDAITTPATGLQLFSTTDSANYVYRGTGGGWQKIANEISGSATLDFPSTNNGNKSDLTINGITGAEEGDVVALGIQNSVNLNHSCFTAWVSAANTVTVRFSNYGTGSLDPVLATFKVKVFK